MSEKELARDNNNVGLTSDSPAPAEEVLDDEDLTVPGSLESIEGSPASPEPEDPEDHSGREQ